MKFLAAAFMALVSFSALAGPPVYVPACSPLPCDDAPAINAALIASCTVQLGSETYHQASLITVPTTCLLDGQGRSTKIVKTANGDMVDMKLGASITNIVLDGDGANFTGRGIVIRSGEHYQRIINTHVSANGYPVHFEANDAGTWASIDDCFIVSWPNLQAYSIKLPDSDSVAGGNRTIRNVRSSGGYGVDIAGANNTFLDRVNMAMIHMNANAAGQNTGAPKTLVVQNSRLGGPIEWRGSGLWIAFNNIANGNWITPDAYDGLFIMTHSNNPIGRQDPAGNNNRIW